MNLGIGAALCYVWAVRVHLVVVEVVVNEKVGASPFVLLEHLQGQGYILTVVTEIIKNLCIGLCKSLACWKQCQCHQQEAF